MDTSDLSDLSVEILPQPVREGRSPKRDETITLSSDSEDNGEPASVTVRSKQLMMVKEERRKSALFTSGGDAGASSSTHATTRGLRDQSETVKKERKDSEMIESVATCGDTTVPGDVSPPTSAPASPRAPRKSRLARYYPNFSPPPADDGDDGQRRRNRLVERSISPILSRPRIEDEEYDTFDEERRREESEPVADESFGPLNVSAMSTTSILVTGARARRDRSSPLNVTFDELNTSIGERVTMSRRGSLASGATNDVLITAERRRLMRAKGNGPPAAATSDAPNTTVTDRITRRRTMAVAVSRAHSPTPSQPQTPAPAPRQKAVKTTKTAAASKANAAKGSQRKSAGDALVTVTKDAEIKLSLLPTLLFDPSDAKSVKAVYDKLVAHSKKVFIEADYNTAEVHPGVADEVYDRGDAPVAVWDKMARKDADKGIKEWKVEYVVGTTIHDSQIYVLARYRNYPIPNWVREFHVEDCDAYYIHKYRQTILDLVEFQLKKKLGEAEFHKRYPNRYLEWEQGEGEGGYVSSRAARYRNKLRANECTYNEINAKNGRAGLMIEDWTGEAELDEELRKLLFTLSLEPNADVQKLIEQYGDQAENIVCGSGCKTCLYSNKSSLPHICCGYTRNIVFDDKGRAVFQKTAKPKTVANFECIPSCHARDAAAKKACKNYSVQTGRTQLVVIFRDPIKGWTLRSGSEMSHCEYLHDYTGTVSTVNSSHRDAQRYDFSMADNLKLENGEEHDALIIHARTSGNETRFISHSCEGNLFVVNVIVERYGAWYNHPTFRAGKTIQAGEEFTFDYLAVKKGDLLDQTFLTYFDDCKCGSRKCRYTPELNAARALRCAAADEEDTDSCDSDEEGSGSDESGEEEEEEEAASEAALLDTSAAAREAVVAAFTGQMKRRSSAAAAQEEASTSAGASKRMKRRENGTVDRYIFEEESD